MIFNIVTIFRTDVNKSTHYYEKCKKKCLQILFYAYFNSPIYKLYKYSTAQYFFFIIANFRTDVT